MEQQTQVVPTLRSFSSHCLDWVGGALDDGQKHCQRQRAPQLLLEHRGQEAREQNTERARQKQRHGRDLWQSSRPT